LWPGNIEYSVGIESSAGDFVIDWTNANRLMTLDRSGNATFTGAVAQGSDARIKKNIATLGDDNGLTAIDQLQPVGFNWRDPSQSKTTQLGFIAQQVETVFPELVTHTDATSTYTPDGMLALNYNGLIAPTVKAVQELDAKVKAQQTQIDAQQQEIQRLEAQVQALQAK